MFCLDVFFNSINCPTVICSPNTCSWRVSTSVDSWEPRSFCHHHCSTVNYALEYFFDNIASVLLLLLLCYYYYCSHITAAFTSPLLLVLFQVLQNSQLRC